MKILLCLNSSGAQSPQPQDRADYSILAHRTFGWNGYRGKRKRSLPKEFVLFHARR
jgi:hypothetical protein